jgi:UDP-N-acetylmuramate dehydrogenase
MYAQAGATLPDIAVLARDAGLKGLEFSTGIPGTVGGGIYMNAGAFGGEISEIFVSARVFLNNEVVTLDCREMNFSYRHCLIRENDGVILDAIFELAEGDPHEISQTMLDISHRRRERQPLDVPSAGSFFKRPEGHFAGKLIQEAGLGGLSVGGAEVSPKHTGFIVNRGGARTADIIDLIEIVRNTVFECSGVMLEPEVRIIGEVSDNI